MMMLCPICDVAWCSTESDRCWVPGCPGKGVLSRATQSAFAGGWPFGLDRGGYILHSDEEETPEFHWRKSAA